MSVLAVDVVVVGAGAFGASTAFHLAQRGRAVALVDRHALVSQTSPRAAGLAVQVRDEPSFARIAQRSVEKIVAFEEETGVPLAYSQAGSLAIARTPEHALHVERHVELGRRTGLEVALVSRSEAAALAPYIEPESALAISRTPSDLHLDEPGDLPRGYVEGARRLGVALLPDTAVEAVELDRGAVSRVVTTRGDLRCATVVDTAGAWAGAVADLVGAPLPIVPARHQLFVTAPLAEVRREHPSVRVTDANVYTRPAAGGLMLGGYEPDPLAVDVDDVDDVEELALDLEPLRRLAAAVEPVFPCLAAAPVAELRGGLPTLTADGLFILDRLPGVRGFYVVAGCNVGGLSTSPAVGESIADWIVDGRPRIDLRPFRLGRFDGWGSARELRDAALLQYSRTEYA
jgi:glycine/D-amino acid oxidase-like deaminating enzyme